MPSVDQARVEQALASAHKILYRAWYWADGISLETTSHDIDLMLREVERIQFALLSHPKPLRASARNRAYPSEMRFGLDNSPAPTELDSPS
jgi:hypothetical protein